MSNCIQWSFIENYTMANARKILWHEFYYLPLRLYHIFKTLILVLLLCILWNKYFVESEIYIIRIQVKFIYKITLLLTYILTLFLFYTYSNKVEYLLWCYPFMHICIWIFYTNFAFLFNVFQFLCFCVFNMTF